MLRDACLVPVLILAIAGTTIGSARAEGPTIARLIEGVTDLTTTDPDLTAFSARMTLSIPFETPFETTTFWRDDGNFGLLTTAGEGRAPLWFLADERSAYFDVCSGSVCVGDGGRLKWKLRLDGEKVKLDYGFGSGEEHGVDVKLRSMIDYAGFRDGVLSTDGNRDLVVESKPTAWGNRTIAVFDATAPHAIRNVEIKNDESGISHLRLYDIRFNDEVQVRWPAMPALDEFPPRIHAYDIDDDEPDPDLVTRMVWLTRSQFGYAGLRETKWREGNMFAGVDWDEAMKHAQALEPLGARLAAEANGDSVDER